MLKPKLVFDQFIDYLDHFRSADDAEVEDQHFDRKEACRPNSDPAGLKKDLGKLREHIQETISAFTNTNPEGGLLVLGIGATGDVRGVNHLADKDCNSLTDIDSLLRGHLVQIRMVDCTDVSGAPNRLILMYAGYTTASICETPGSRPRSWRRAGRQNILMSDDQKDQIRREKRIVDFERRIACPFDPALLDDGLMKIARAAWAIPTESKVSDEELLFQKGAVERDGRKTFFTNAGLLFFAANPQRVIATAFVRLLRFESSFGDDTSPRQPTLDKRFGGALPKQIQDVRTYLTESALLRKFTWRTADGTFLEEPEYPSAAIDEAIVNAIIHRDYGANWPIECRYFQDGFEVRNPGRMLQRNAGVPDQFLLSQIQLHHYARNSKLFEWLKDIRDFRGSPFVLGVAEGTRSMRQAMADLKLPSPEYHVAEAETVLLLRNDVKRRISEIESPRGTQPPRHANVYALRQARDGVPFARIDRDKRREFLSSLREGLQASGWFIDSLKFGRLTVHLQGGHFPAPPNVLRVVRLFPAYRLSIWEWGRRELLCVDYCVEVKNVCSARSLLTHFAADDLIGRTAVANWNGWQRCRVVSVDAEWASVRLLDYDHVENLQARLVIPDLPTRLIKNLLLAEGISFDLNKAIKTHSLASVPNASRIRAEKTQSAVNELSRTLFPLEFDGQVISLDPVPVALDETGADHSIPIQLLNEPPVEFGDHRETPDIRDGITRFGSFEDKPREIELVPVVVEPQRRQMEQLIDRLRAGKFKYRGAERTFASRLTYNGIVAAPDAEGVVSECQRLVKDHPEWVRGSQLDRIFLVHAPEAGYASDDEASPYFRLKRFLLEAGCPCQMVDTPTIANPDWKDLNLALNVTAKCGLTPWVLPHAIPDADFFVGLSYTENRVRDGERLMGYANVFNEFGRWQFFSGNTNVFSYDDKAKHFRKLVSDTLSRLPLCETPCIYFHYTAQFSREDRDAILSAAKSVKPNGIYTFIWINTHHDTRFYDSRAAGDGSIPRGSFIITSPHRVYVSTTGNNPYRKLLGTPVVLEVNVRREFPPDISPSAVDLRTIAAQILALTKLNWASTDSLCGEPITTKYAGDIARLTAAFMRQSGAFQLHSRLEQTPWFI